MDKEQRPPSGSGVALALATLAFVVCFAVWGLISPLAPLFGDLYKLSATQVGLLVAVPVVLGSLARIPLGTSDGDSRMRWLRKISAAAVPRMFLGASTAQLGDTAHYAVSVRPLPRRDPVGVWPGPTRSACHFIHGVRMCQPSTMRVRQVSVPIQASGSQDLLA